MSEALQRVKAWLKDAPEEWPDEEPLATWGGSRLLVSDLRALVAELEWQPINYVIGDDDNGRGWVDGSPCFCLESMRIKYQRAHPTHWRPLPEQPK